MPVARTRCRFLTLTLRPVTGEMLAHSTVRAVVVVVVVGGWGGAFSGDSPQLQEGAAIKEREEEEAILQNRPQWALEPKPLTNQKKIIWTKRRELSGAVL